MKTEEEIKQIYALNIEATRKLKIQAINSNSLKDFEVWNLAATSYFSRCQVLAEVLGVKFDVNQFDY